MSGWRAAQKSLFRERDEGGTVLRKAIVSPGLTMPFGTASDHTTTPSIATKTRLRLRWGIPRHGLPALSGYRNTGRRPKFWNLLPSTAANVARFAA